MFEEAHDYTVLTFENRGSKNIEGAKEYTLSLEMAKHLAMMENTPRGYQVRGYFIECETSLKEILIISLLRIE